MSCSQKPTTTLSGECIKCCKYYGMSHCSESDKILCEKCNYCIICALRYNTGCACGPYGFPDGEDDYDEQHEAEKYSEKERVDIYKEKIIAYLEKLSAGSKYILDDEIDEINEINNTEPYDWSCEIKTIQKIQSPEIKSHFSQLECKTIEKKIKYLYFLEFAKAYPEATKSLNNKSFSVIIDDIQKFFDNLCDGDATITLKEFQEAQKRNQMIFSVKGVLKSLGMLKC